MQEYVKSENSSSNRSFQERGEGFFLFMWRNDPVRVLHSEVLVQLCLFQFHQRIPEEEVVDVLDPVWRLEVEEDDDEEVGETDDLSYLCRPNQ